MKQIQGILKISAVVRKKKLGSVLIFEGENYPTFSRDKKTRVIWAGEPFWEIKKIPSLSFKRIYYPAVKNRLENNYRRNWPIPLFSRLIAARINS